MIVELLQHPFHRDVMIRVDHPVGVQSRKMLSLQRDRVCGPVASRQHTALIVLRQQGSQQLFQLVHPLRNDEVGALIFRLLCNTIDSH